MKSLFTGYILVHWLTLTTTYAQQVKTQVAQVYETRMTTRWETSSVPSLFLTVEIEGVQTGPSQLIKLNTLTRAEDNLGNALTDLSDTKYTYNEYSNYDIHLTAPPRKATEITVLEGTFKYFTPTVANKGLVTIDNPVSKLGTNILKGKYKDVAIVLLDRKKLQELKKTKPELYSKERAKLKKEYGGGAENLEELDQVLDDPYFGTENELFFFVRDPEGITLRLTIRDAEDTILSSSASFATGGHISYSLQSPLDKTFKLELLVESPQAIKILPFSIKNIQLP